MSFGSTGFGGFGSNNNNQQQQSTGFGGFGGTPANNNTGGFGSSTGFGQSTNATASPFGAPAATNTGFGATSGFGNTSTTSPFGQKPAFGQAAGGGGSLFGGTTNNTASTGGFGTFGQATNTANTGFGATSSGFGSNTASTGFGSTSNTGGSLFGGGNTTNTGFGATNTTGGFGAATNNNTGFGATAASSTQNNGTGGTPFTEFTEKDQNTTNKFQSITCQPQYSNFSFEELRTTDYSQGRKHGNASGQAGAFGASTGFGGGGFGQTNNTTTGGFGSTTNNTGGMFGQQQNTGGFGAATNGTGFGSNTGGGLFGQAKPATSIFGGTTTTTPNTGGGIFGSTNNNTATGGFGSTSNSSPFGGANTGSVFGQPSKTPGTFGVGTGTGFGSTNTTSAFGAPANTGSGFGQTNNTNTTGGGLFGQTANNNTSGFGGFGQQNQQNQNQTTNAFGSFGQNNQNNQAKPLFGQTNTTGVSAFGQPAQQSSTNNLFGNTQNQNQTTNAFGGFGQKPATPTNNLFGQTTNNNTGTSLFGQIQNNQNQGGSLFGQTQQKPSLFGSTNTSNTGGGLFGSSQNNNQQQNNSLFGNTQNQQSGFGGGNSMFNGSLQGNQQQLTTSIMSNNPYGNEHLFANLGSPQQAVGPLATPLSSSQKARKPAPLPSYKLNPSASSRLITPQKRSGYGFDYSSYGTPGSAYSTASSPMYSGSLLSTSRFGGSSLNRSLSTNSLVRSSLSPSESILNPNAFSTGGSRAGGSGSLKKLRINRNLRTDLFGSADGSPETARTSPLKKSVTFGGEEHEQQENSPNSQTSQALVRVQEDDQDMPSAEEQGYLRSSGSKNAPRTNGAPARPEMSQVRKEPAANAEKQQPAAAKAKNPAEKERESAILSQNDMVPGDYWMTPSLEDIKKMSRKELSNIEPFTVGREGCGQIEFAKVDLTEVNLDDIIEHIVHLGVRSATVYQDHENKPDEGKDLNVPAVVTMCNSFPRTRGGKVQIFEKKGPKFDKHLQRLQKVDGTEFLEYRAEKGEWVFAVQHFSTYELDYSDDNDSVMDSPVGGPASQGITNTQGDTSMVSNESSVQDSNVDDTFEFRSSRALPGAFDQDEQMYDEESRNGVHEEQQDIMSDEEENNAVVQGHGMNDRKDSSVFNDTLPVDEEEEESFQKHSPGFAASLKPKSILKASQGFRASHSGTPTRKPVIGADWATQLQRTISPKKQDRQTLRESQGIFSTAPFLQSTRDRPQVNFAASTKMSKDTKPFATSIDLMNSLFGQSTNKVAEPATKPAGFQWPYAKRPDASEGNMPSDDKAFHNSFRPSWAANGTLVFKSASNRNDSALVQVMAPVMSEAQEIQFAGLSNDVESSSKMLAKQLEISDVVSQDGIPGAKLNVGTTFSDLISTATDDTPNAQHEKETWKLASILFDNDIAQHERKENLQSYWKDLTKPAATKQVENFTTAEEKAIIQLSTNDVWTASETLSAGRDFRLATMVAQIGGDESMRQGMTQQINHWLQSDVASEMTPAIRALYALLAGETCICDGKGGSVGRENRAETFNISQKFGLDWKRALGLRLWYGITSEEPISVAIQAFEDDLGSGKEQVTPVPWFVEDDVDLGWPDVKRKQRQDIKWGLLKIYAAKQSSPTSQSDINLGTIIAMENTSGNPLDARMSFQLYQVLRSLHIADFAEDEADERSDLLTTTLISQLSSKAQHLPYAVLASLYLIDASARKSTIHALLERHASVIGESADTCAIFRTLVQDLKVPEPWIWSAKALYAKSVLADEHAQIRCLLRAGEIVEAHETLRRSVGPSAIIQEDVEGLSTLLQACVNAGAEDLTEWSQGGAIYIDYARLLSLEQGQDFSQEEVKAVARRLQQAVDSVRGSGRKVELEERVALSEVRSLLEKARSGWEGDRGIVQEVERREKENEVLMRTVRLSEEFYGNVGVSVGA